jgi:hypothetical protein
MIDDMRLDSSTIGVGCKIMNLPDGWDFSVEGLATVMKNGKDSIRRAVVELENHGYIKRIQSKAGGLFAGYEWEIIPNGDGLQDLPYKEKPRSLDSRPTDDQTTEIKSQSNIKESNTNKSNIKDINHVFEFWNSQKIILHKSITKDTYKAINNKLKDYSVDEVLKTIRRYSIILNDKDFFFSCKWSLYDFLKQKNAFPRFTEEGSMTANYKDKIKPKQNSKWQPNI